jgi:hypothetical protein
MNGIVAPISLAAGERLRMRVARPDSDVIVTRRSARPYALAALRGQRQEMGPA